MAFVKYIEVSKVFSFVSYSAKGSDKNGIEDKTKLCNGFEWNRLHCEKGYSGRQVSLQKALLEGSIPSTQSSGMEYI